jgi:hypothetical protein
MARGWDSKAVEEQIESAAVAATFTTNPEKSEHELTRIRARQGLEMMRSRVKQQIERTQNDRYREMLDRELTALDQQLSELS